MKGIDRTNQRAIGVTAIDARLNNYIGHNERVSPHEKIGLRAIYNPNILRADLRAGTKGTGCQVPGIVVEKRRVAIRPVSGSLGAWC